MHKPTIVLINPKIKFSNISAIHTSLELAPNVFNRPKFLSLVSFNSLNKLAINKIETKIKI